MLILTDILMLIAISLLTFPCTFPYAALLIEVCFIRLSDGLPSTHSWDKVDDVESEHDGLR